LAASAAAAPSAGAYSFGWAACATPSPGVCNPAESAPQVVYDWDAPSGGACDPDDSPDGPVHAFRFRNSNGDWRVQMGYGQGLGNRRLIGPDLLSAKREMDPTQPAAERRPCGTGGLGGPPTGDIVMPSHNSSDPSTFDNIEWLTSPYLVSDGAGGGVVHTFIHNEFHGELFRSPIDQCPTGNLNDCWYASITLASSDGSEQPGLVNALGAEYRHPSSGPKLVASIPYPYNPGPPPFGRQGFAAHSNPIKVGPHYYMLGYISARYNAQPGPGNCLLRTTDLSDPTSWRAWGGTPPGFNIPMTDPYGGGFDPAAHACTPVSPSTLSSVVRLVVWNRYLEKFMAVGTLGGTAVFSLSDDGVNWTEQQLLAAPETPAGGCLEILHYPVLMDPSDPAASGAAGPVTEPEVTPNFDHPGRSSYLYFTRQNRIAPGCAQSTNRDLVRIPVQLQQRRTTLEEGLLGGDYGYDVKTATGSSTLNLVNGTDYDADSSNNYAEARTVVDTGSRWASGWLAANQISDGDDVWYGSAFFLPNDFLTENTTVDLMKWESSAGTYGGGIRLLGSGTATDRLRLFRSNGTTTYLGPAEGFAPPLGKWFWLEVHQKLGKTPGSPTLNEVFLDGRLVVSTTEQNRETADTGDVVRLKYGIVHNSSPAGTDTSLRVDRSTLTAAPMGPVGAPTPPTGLRASTAGQTYTAITANLVQDPFGRPLQYKLYKRFDGRWGLRRTSRSPAWMETGLPCNTPTAYRVTAVALGPGGVPAVESLPSAPVTLRTTAC
jgi:hypothetical protein